MILYNILFGWYSISFFINLLLTHILIKQFGVCDYYLRSPRANYLYFFGYLWFLDKKRIRIKLKTKELERLLRFYESYEYDILASNSNFYEKYFYNKIKTLSRELKLLKLTKKC